MIDNKKIEEAKDNIFNKYFLKNNEGMICIDHISEPVYLDYQIKQAIELGAKWAINEFLKDLWHPADEMPNENNEVICVDKDSRTITYNGIVNWWAFCRTHDVTHWLYVDDLLPKKGGEQ